MGAPVNPVWVSGHYRFENDDGTLNTSTFIAAEDVAITQLIDAKFRLRLNWGESAGQNQGDTLEAVLQFRINGGTYQQVTASTAVQYAASSNETDGNTSTTERLTTPPTGVATYVDSEFDENQATRSNAPVDEYYEIIFNLIIDSAQVSNDDTIDFQIVGAAGGTKVGVLDSYDTVPSLTVSKVTNVVNIITAGTMNWAEQAFKKNMAVIPALGIWPAWTEQALKKNMAVIPAAGNINWSGQPFKVLAAVVNIITAGVMNWTGQNVTANARSSRDIVVGALNWAAQALKVNRSRTIANGVMNWLGQNLVALQSGGTVPSINDAKLNKLETALAKSGHVSDLEVEWLQSLDASVISGDVDTAWHQYWDFLGIPAGARNGRAYAWLGGLGHTGSLNNRWLLFWQSP